MEKNENTKVSAGYKIGKTVWWTDCHCPVPTDTRSTRLCLKCATYHFAGCINPMLCGCCRELQNPQSEEFVLDACFKKELKMKMEDEIRRRRDLKSVTFTTPQRCTGIKLENFILPVFINVLNRHSSFQFIGGDFGRLFMSSRELSLSSFLKMSADDMCEVEQLAPPAITSIRGYSVPKIFQAAIEKNTETLRIAIYKGMHITFAHLIALGNCKSLTEVDLTGDLEVIDETSETFHNIVAKRIKLEGNFQCSNVGDIFFSETLESFTASYSTILGFEYELLTKCTELKDITINMESEKEGMDNELLSIDIKTLVARFKQHKTLRIIRFMNIHEDVKVAAWNPLHEILGPIKNCEGDSYDYPLSSPAIFIRIKPFNFFF